MIEKLILIFTLFLVFQFYFRIKIEINLSFFEFEYKFYIINVELFGYHVELHTLKEARKEAFKKKIIGKLIPQSTSSKLEINFNILFIFY